MITRDTAAAIWNAYREIDAGEQLLADLLKSREEDRGADKHAATLKDSFGRLRHLQLGIPSGPSQHTLLAVSPALGESVIRAHIANKRAELVEVNEKARLELSGDVREEASRRKLGREREGKP